jgi:hypothetical protein
MYWQMRWIPCRYSLKDVHAVSSGLWHTLPLDILAESMQQVGDGVLKVMGAIQFEGGEPKPPLAHAKSCTSLNFQHGAMYS